MSWTTRIVLRAGCAAMMTAAVLGFAARAAHAADEFVKYYTVKTSHEGSKENISEIAERFLGDRARSGDVFNLNSGRPQPDGQVLTDSARLNPGWMLVLPWDAVGAEVQYGKLPDKSPNATVPHSPNTTQAPTPAKPSPRPRPSAGDQSGQCATAAASSSTSSWAELRLAADQAWPQSRGKGQLVAVVDSGVAGSLSNLTRHVAIGSDIVSGGGRGDTDCLGTGTAMAGLIVAQKGSRGGITGIAPDAAVLPIRIAGTNTKVKATDAAAGIGAAVASGATVIALGSYVDSSQKVVTDAIAKATAQDIVVVLGAASGSVPANLNAKPGDGTLRIAGIGADGQAAADYRKGGIDLVAPGVNVPSFAMGGAGSVTGSGTHYAVALDAGAAALVRTAYPELDAEQVTHRMEATAHRIGSGPAPDAGSGWGLIDPVGSVTKVLPEEAGAFRSGRPGPARSGSGAGGRSGQLLIVTLIAGVAAVLLAFRIRRLLRGETATESFSPAGQDEPAADPAFTQEPTLITPGVRPRPGVGGRNAATVTAPACGADVGHADQVAVPAGPAPAEAGPVLPRSSVTELTASDGARQGSSADGTTEDKQSGRR